MLEMKLNWVVSRNGAVIIIRRMVTGSRYIPWTKAELRKLLTPRH